MPAETISAETIAAARRALPSEVRAAWLFLAPGLAIIFLFFLLPIAAALLLSLTDFDLYAVADWRNLRFVGFEQLHSPAARSAVLEGDRATPSTSCWSAAR